MATLSASPALVIEVRASLETLRAEAVAPAGLPGVKRVVGKRFSIWRPRERPDAEWSAFWGDYEAALGEMPESALEAGMKAWIKGGATRLPYPGELLPLAKNAVTPEATAYARGLKLVDIAPLPQIAERKPDPVDTTSIMAAFRDAMSKRRDDAQLTRLRRPASFTDAQWNAVVEAEKAKASRQRKETPPISASVGQTGVSEELLDQIYGPPASEAA